jgi:two-component system sensor histidine kinase RpfC
MYMSQAVAPNHRFTVLLANEQEGWHQTVRQLLQPQGVETVSARSGREALNLMESRPFHCAVLDAHMPQLGGLQVIKLMREVQSRRDATQAIPPAILLANQLTSHLLHEALGMHVFSVLSKPVDFNVLLDTLARVLRRHYENKWPCESASDEPVGGNGNGHANGNGHRQAS